MMASSSLPTATAVPSCEGEVNREMTAFLTGEPPALDEDEGGEPLSLLRPHEEVRKKSKLLKTINWANDCYELCIEKRAEEQSGPLFVVFVLGETPSGKKFSCVISNKEQASLHLHEGAPLGLCGMESLCQFLEDAFLLQKPGFSCSLPEFVESSASSVSLTISYDNGLSGYATVQFQVQVHLALFYNPSEVELVMKQKVGALEERMANEARALREEVYSLRQLVQQLQGQFLEERVGQRQLVQQFQAQLVKERAAATELRKELSCLRYSVKQAFQIHCTVRSTNPNHNNCCHCYRSNDPNGKDGLVHRSSCGYIRQLRYQRNTARSQGQSAACGVARDTNSRRAEQLSWVDEIEDP